MTLFLLTIFRYGALFAVSAILGVIGFISVLTVSSMKESAPAKAAEIMLVSEKSPEPKLVMMPESKITAIEFDGIATPIARVAEPVDLSCDANGTQFLLERNGAIRRIGQNERGERAITVYADLNSEEVESSVGFSALAFHPQFQVPGTLGYGRFYVVVAEKAESDFPSFRPEFGSDKESHQDVIYEYSTQDPYAEAFEGTRREILRLSQPGAEHNLSSIAFDSESYLYIAVGDGTDAKLGENSPAKNATSLNTVYGKILRINPVKASRGRAYSIPESNPFAFADEALPEIWACGLRSPGTLSYDPYLQAMSLTEQGMHGQTEINVSLSGAEHFGWEVIDSLPPATALEKAKGIISAPRILWNEDNDATRGVGGFVYRGERFPSLSGKVIFASESGDLMAATSRDSDDPRSFVRLDIPSLPKKSLSSIRQGLDGEIFVLCSDGEVFELQKEISASNHRKSRRPLVCAVLY